MIASRASAVSGPARSARYEIRVEGILDQRWTASFEGLQIGSDDSQTVISGPVADQAVAVDLPVVDAAAAGQRLRH